MRPQQTQITDRYTAPLMAFGAMLLAAGVVVAMIAEGTQLLDVACLLMLVALGVAFVAGISRHRYEQALRATHETERRFS